jgi:hypothetical protein
MPLPAHFSELAVAEVDVARALVWGVRPSNKAPTP